LVAHIQDGTGFVGEEYGSLGAALTVGITVKIIDALGATSVDLTDGDPIKTNADWGKFCSNPELVLFGAGDDFINARWAFSETGTQVRLLEGEKLVVTCNDDMSALAAHTFVAAGYIEAPPVMPAPYPWG
jgi:hypothetical protein